MTKDMKKVENSLEDLAKVAVQSEDLPRRKPVLVKRRDFDESPSKYRKIDWQTSGYNLISNIASNNYEVAEKNIDSYMKFARKVVDRHNKSLDMSYGVDEYKPAGMVSKHLRENRVYGVYSDVETVADKFCTTLEDAVIADKFYRKNVGYDEEGKVREISWEVKEPSVDVPMEVIRPKEEDNYVPMEVVRPKHDMYDSGKRCEEIANSIDEEIRELTNSGKNIRKGFKEMGNDFREMGNELNRISSSYFSKLDLKSGLKNFFMGTLKFPFSIGKN